MAGPMLVQNVQIVSASVTFDEAGAIATSTYMLRAMAGGTLQEAGISLTWPGEVQLAVGSLYQLSITPA